MKPTDLHGKTFLIRALPEAHKRETDQTPFWSTRIKIGNRSDDLIVEKESEAQSLRLHIGQWVRLAAPFTLHITEAPNAGLQVLARERWGIIRLSQAENVLRVAAKKTEDFALEMGAEHKAEAFKLLAEYGLQCCVDAMPVDPYTRKQMGMAPKENDNG